VRIVRIDAIPMTNNGKLDVRRLPEVNCVPQEGIEYVAPTGEVETALRSIWCNVLPATGRRIGIYDDFFGLGGDSLRAIKLAQEVTGMFGPVLKVADVFNHTTIEAQAHHIQRSSGTWVEREQKGECLVGFAARHVGEAPASLAQERLLFIDDFVGGTAAYNIS